MTDLISTANENHTEAHDVPLLPLRDVVVYPYMVIPLFVGREKSIAALEAAMQSKEKYLFLAAQKTANQDEPREEDIYRIGCKASILQLLKLPDGTVKVLIEGLQRGRIKQFTKANPYMSVDVEFLESVELEEKEADVLSRALVGQFEKYVKLNKKIPIEIVNSVSSIEHTSRLTDTIAAHLSLKVDEKQQLLDTMSCRERIEKLMSLMEAEIDLLQVEQRIRSNVRRQMEKSQREYYLNEQMKAIQEELGTESSDINDIKEKIEAAGMTEEAKEKALAELEKIKMMPPMSAEATVSRNYLDWMLAVPWKERSKIRLDLNEAKKILDQDHYGLEKIKDRILEYLAVQKRVSKVKGNILCLVGPPGVGKTSLGQSIARATRRQYVRMALGGVRDEAEIRGHRRTYIGAMPGKILQKLSKVKVKNPLFLLDEIDKMAMDFRGDPASALLEVLDPEQNVNFNDHYLEVDYDLSDVMFVATANSLNIPPALRDRMEVIQLSGYTEDEKMHIAIDYLVPKQIKQNGLKKNELKVSDQALLDIVRYYTREAGVRSLEREVAKLCRKVVKEIQMTKTPITLPLQITPDNLEEYLGVKKFRFGMAEEKDCVGEVTGLAWTEVGGEILTIESVVMPGKGVITRTGKLGDVMQESIQAALTVVRARGNALGIVKDAFEKHDIHIHVPEGATPKDGPSAGIAMCTALVSAFTQIPVRADVAMTGEITLRGEVLPIGGLKEKLLAARRAGIKHVIIPEENRRDLKDIPANVQSELVIHCVRWIDEVFELALSRMPTPVAEPEKASGVVDTGSGAATTVQGTKKEANIN